MDYKKYYENQVGHGSFPVFRGYPNQKGYGLGGIFKSLYKFIMPLFKTHALPVLKKGAEALGTVAIKTAANIANDAVSGKNIKDSARDHMHNAINTLSEKAQSTLQAGSGRKRGVKRKANEDIMSIVKKPRKKVRRLKDIFDQ